MQTGPHARLTDQYVAFFTKECPLTVHLSPFKCMSVHQIFLSATGGLRLLVSEFPKLT